jgi:NADH-quinone oxidoreductase subunit N
MIPQLDVWAVAPMMPVALGVLVLPLFDVFLLRRGSLLGQPLSPARRSTYLAAVSLLFLSASLLVTMNAFSQPVRTFNPENPMVRMDGVALFLCAVVQIGAMLTVLGSSKYLEHVHSNWGEFYTLVLSSVTGMMFLAAASDLLMLFLALELMSIPVYALAGFHRASLRSNESAVKYFLIGSFASGLLLYGSALLYGATGSLALSEIATSFDPENALDLCGAGLVLTGLAFKISSVPFHQWAPDTYEGAPTPISGFMATTVKVAAFGVLVRVVAVALQPASDSIVPVLWVLSVLSMTVGNVMALIQRNTKRMLAYSSIAHAGYILIGVLVGGEAGTRAVLFYLLSYTFMTIGAFTVVAVLARDGREYDALDDLAGLGQTRPFLAVVMSVCMFSLLGMPATAGFVGKFLLFSAAVQQGIATGSSSLVWLVVIAVLNSALSLGYYLRVPAIMFFQPPREDVQSSAPGSFEAIVLVTCAAAILLLGLMPQDALPFLVSLLHMPDVNVLQLASDAAASLAGAASP